MKKNRTLLLSILSVSLLCDAGMGINPIVQALANAFPGISYNTILYATTLPYFTCMAVSFVFGFITGKKVGYKPVLAGGLGCILVGGVMPAFMASSFVFLLTARVILGLGLGLLISINAYILCIYEGKDQGKVLGLHIAMMNIGTVFMQLLSGYLGSIKWEYSSYIYMIAIVSLILVLVNLEEPTKAKNGGNRKKEKIVIKPKGYFYIALMAFVTCIGYPILALMSTHIEDLGIGDTAVSGIVLCFYTVGGAVGGFAYSRVSNLFKRMTFSVLCLPIVIGYIIMFIGRDPVTMSLATFLCGFGVYPMTSLFPDWLGEITDEASLPMACSLLYVGIYGACFVSIYWMNLCEIMFGNIITGSFAACIVLTTAIGVLCAIFNISPFPKERMLLNAAVTSGGQDD